MSGRGDLALSHLERRSPDGDFLTFVARVLATSGLRGAVIGGEARNHWAVPRLTYDLDLTVAADPTAEEAALAQLLDAGFEILRAQRRESPSGPDFLQLYQRDWHQMLEMQAAKTPFQEGLIDRSVELRGLEPLRVATPEDILVLKLIASRKKDQDDLREMGRIEGIDWGYIEHWAAIWDVLDRLAILRAELAQDEQLIRDLYS